MNGDPRSWLYALGESLANDAGWRPRYRLLRLFKPAHHRAFVREMEAMERAEEERTDRYFVRNRPHTQPVLHIQTATVHEAADVALLTKQLDWHRRMGD